MHRPRMSVPDRGGDDAAKTTDRRQELGKGWSRAAAARAATVTAPVDQVKNRHNRGAAQLNRKASLGGAREFDLVQREQADRLR